MKSDWEIYKLGDFVNQDFDSAEKVELDKSYSMVGVYSYGKGLFGRDEVLGMNTSYKTFYKLKSAHIVFSQLFAWEGAIAISSDKFEGKYVSAQFPTFLVNEKIADRKFISYFLQQRIIWKKLFEVGVGMGSRRRTLNPSKFLNLSIPLPPLSEQQRIVAKIESVKSRIEQIQQLRAEQEREIENLRNCIFIDLQKEFESIPIGKILVPHIEGVAINPDENYKQVMVRMEHKGVLQRGIIKGSEIGSKQYLANENDFIISKIDARNGAMGMIPQELDGAIVTGDFPLYNFTEEVNPNFFYYFSNTFYFDNACKQASEGTTNRKRLKLDRFSNIQIPLPPIEEQNRIVSFLEKVTSIKQTYKQQEQELTDLLPSLLDKAFKGEMFADETAAAYSTATEAKVLYEPKSSIPKNKKGFAKQVLGGKIVSLFKDDKQFTNIKFQKLQYLAEHIIEEDLNWNYYRQSAGPYDNKFMHSVFDKLWQNQWFENRNYKFYPLKKANDIEHYYQNYFGNKEEKLSKLFSLLKNASEKFCEALATIYAVWNNHIIQNLALDKSGIKNDFFDWSNRKEQKFTNDEFDKTLDWMNKHNIVPTGFGYLIKEKK